MGEPTQEEIENYAEWLGIDKDKDNELIPLAREGLKAPLPEGWRPCQNAEGEIFYFNFDTGQSSWDHPADEHYQNLVQESKRAKAQKDLPKENQMPQQSSAQPPQYEAMSSYQRGG